MSHYRAKESRMKKPKSEKASVTDNGASQRAVATARVVAQVRGLTPPEAKMVLKATLALVDPNVFTSSRP